MNKPELFRQGRGADLDGSTQLARSQLRGREHERWPSSIFHPRQPRRPAGNRRRSSLPHLATRRHSHRPPRRFLQEGALCALDLLSASGFINYFGRLELPADSLDDDEALGSGLQVKPVLLQKGDTKLALYGMGNIRDERFHYEMKHNRIKMFRPAEDPDDWFNILLVHQNRCAALSLVHLFHVWRGY